MKQPKEFSYKPYTLGLGEGVREGKEGKKRERPFPHGLPGMAEFGKADVYAHRREGCPDVSFPLSLTLTADSVKQT